MKKPGDHLPRHRIGAPSRPGREDGSPTQLQLVIMAIQQDLDRLFHADEHFGDPNKLTEAGRTFRAEQVTTRFHELITSMEDSAKTFVCQAILDGDLSRKRAAELLGVHQATMGRWVKEYGAELAAVAEEKQESETGDPIMDDAMNRADKLAEDPEEYDYAKMRKPRQD